MVGPMNVFEVRALSSWHVQSVERRPARNTSEASCIPRRGSCSLLWYDIIADSCVKVTRVQSALCRSLVASCRALLSLWRQSARIPLSLIISLLPP